jgi:hypothetical protein
MNLLRALRPVFLLVVLTSSAAIGSTAVPLEEIIARARAYVGTEAALEGLRSVHFVGTLETTEPTADGPRPVRARIEIYFRKPFQQRIELTMGDRVEITALDEYEGWQRVRNSGESGPWRLNLLGINQIRRLRANTWENLAFYRGLERSGGRVEDLGTAEIEGRRVRKIAFVHSPEIVFNRFFDEETGRLVRTETEKQGVIREEGELRAGGLRFPAKIITVNALPDGSSREVVVSFERVAVNETLADELFALPPVRAR